MVQAAPHVWKGNAADPSRTWRRTEIKGEVPLTLRMAEWALRPSERTSDEETEERGPRSALGVINTCFRVLIVSLPLQALLAFPGAGNPWDTDDVEDTYLDYPGYHWSWPKHAINPLDMSPGAPSAKNMPKFSVKKRAIRPRKLMVLRGEDFAEVLDPPADLQYLFISWKWDSFIRNDGSETASHGVARLKSMAAYATREAGLRAYWFDGLNQSISNERDSTSDQKQLLSQDVYSMSDIIRGSHHVALMLPNDDPKEMAGWGERIWTLPEGLLAPGNIDVWRWSDTGVHTKWIWSDPEDDWDDPPARILAEHFEGGITLSRLELFSTAIAALSARKTSEDHTGADKAYALMGLLHYRIEPCAGQQKDDLFQVLARLSLANDNDQLIERMIGLFPYAAGDAEDLFRQLTKADQMGQERPVDAGPEQPEPRSAGDLSWASTVHSSRYRDRDAHAKRHLAQCQGDRVVEALSIESGRPGGRDADIVTGACTTWSFPFAKNLSHNPGLNPTRNPSPRPKSSPMSENRMFNS
ncbi:hypothetical protein M8818_000964 [Zalaria obscura]|uniref:Uncharacterized protein n=1 Tax=Zalaria obscura TaxID=2024903 RepID=A0ACC3SL84_9PEZI